MIRQAGVIPYRVRDQETEILLITSSSGKRWVIPKGWTERFQTAAEAAAREAWEEAGIVGKVRTPAIGSYSNHKWGYPFQVEVFLMQVEGEQDTYPESHRRKRQWMSSSEAIKHIKQAELKRLFQQLPSLIV